MSEGCHSTHPVFSQGSLFFTPLVKTMRDPQDQIEFSLDDLFTIAEVIGRKYDDEPTVEPTAAEMELTAIWADTQKNNQKED